MFFIMRKKELNNIEINVAGGGEPSWMILVEGMRQKASRITGKTTKFSAFDFESGVYVGRPDQNGNRSIEIQNYPIFASWEEMWINRDKIASGEFRLLQNAYQAGRMAQGYLNPKHNLSRFAEKYADRIKKSGLGLFIPAEYPVTLPSGVERCVFYCDEGTPPKEMWVRWELYCRQKGIDPDDVITYSNSGDKDGNMPHNPNPSIPTFPHIHVYMRTKK
jgi:hypothetical protein